MSPYMFVINATPMPSNKDCEDIASAIVHIWVYAEDKEKAKEQAIDYIKSYLWDTQDFEHEFEIHKEQIDRLHESEFLLYQKALVHGIAADFLASPKIPGNPNDPITLKRLRKF